MSKTQAALRLAKRYAEGGVVEELADRVPTRITVRPLPKEEPPLSDMGDMPYYPDSGPFLPREEIDPREMAGLPGIRDRQQLPLEPIHKHIAQDWQDSFSPWAKDEHGVYEADKPIPHDGSKGKVPQITQDPRLWGGLAAADIATSLPSFGGLVKGGLKAVAGAFPRVVKPAEKAAKEAAEAIKPMAKPAPDDWSKPPEEIIGAERSVSEDSTRELADFVRQIEEMPHFSNLDRATIKELNRIDAGSQDPGGLASRIHSEAGGVPKLIASTLFDISEHNLNVAKRLLNEMPKSQKDDILNHLRDLENKERAASGGFPPYDPVAAQATSLADRYATELRAPRGMIGAGGAKVMDSVILPHYGGDPAKFVDHYFAGMFNPQSMRIGGGFYDDYDKLKMTGNLRHGVAEIDRTIFKLNDSGKSYADHGWFKLKHDKQASGIAKTLLRNQVDLYKDLNLSHVDLYANVDVGGYAWAKYGFKPTSHAGWASLAKDLGNRVGQYEMAQLIDKKTSREIRGILALKDPGAIWSLVDYPVLTSFNNESVGKPVNWGKELLLGRRWNGRMDLQDRATMRRFKKYVGQER